MTIYLLRHGQTEWNTEQRFQGSMDSPLTDRGVAQAYTMGTALADLLRSHGTDVSDVTIDSSPLGRVRRTAEIVARELGVPESGIRFSDLLKEASFGVWQGLTWAEVGERFPGAIEEREANKWEYRIPEGEPYCLTYERAVEFLDTPCETPVRVIVTHEVMSRCLRGAYARLSPARIVGESHRHGAVYLLADGSIKEIATDT